MVKVLLCQCEGMCDLFRALVTRFRSVVDSRPQLLYIVEIVLCPFDV